MSVPSGIDADAGPPSQIPLQHFVVGLAFLVFGYVAGVASMSGGYGLHLVHIHLLLVGWVCITIMGAMTQFVPVWSNVTLHSRRLGGAQLVLVAVGVAGLAAAFGTGRFRVAVYPGVVAVAGFWLFVYNIGRTLPSLNPRRLDVTERHFGFALAMLIVATSLGAVLALNYAVGVLGTAAPDRGGILSAHATAAVLGVVVATVLGAMYQLVEMFTQTEVHGIGVYAQRFEEMAYPAGVVLLVAGSLAGSSAAAVAGMVIVSVSLGGFVLVVARRLYETRMPVADHPMLVRYVPAVVALTGWVAVVPLRISNTGDVFGDAGAAHLLLVGFVGFVVVGTLYHVVPFLIWVNEYSSRIGLEDVPMVDDLYDRRLERADLVLTVVGSAGTIGGLWLGGNALAAVSGSVLLVGYAVFVTNTVVTVRRHHPEGIAGLARPSGSGAEPETKTEANTEPRTDM